MLKSSRHTESQKRVLTIYRIHTLVLLILAFVFTPITIGAEPYLAQTETDQAKVTLYSVQDKLVSGQDLQVVLKFEIKKGWHISWKNPGDAGLEPKFEWSTPDYINASKFSWPAPKLLKESFLELYVFEDILLLPATIKTNLETDPAKRHKIDLSLRWLVCHEICIPQSGDLSSVSYTHLTLPTICSV